MSEYTEALRERLAWALRMRNTKSADAETAWSRYQDTGEEFWRLSWEDDESERRRYAAEVTRLTTRLAEAEAGK